MSFSGKWSKCMAVLYDVYVMCQEHAYQDFKMFVAYRAYLVFTPCNSLHGVFL